MKLLDRYVLRNFLEPFFICFGGFLAIWIIFDISDNSSDFIEAKASTKQIVAYYLTQLPQYILVCLPVGLLLALLYSLSRMSRSNELISMLTAGRSVFRVLVPLFGIGVLASGACLWLNWEQAPHAESIKKVAVSQIRKGRKVGEAELVSQHLFRDRQNNRTWYVRRLRPGSARLEGVHITQQDAEGRITRKWYANRALYDPRLKTWTLEKGMTVEFTPEGDIASTDHFPNKARVISDWSETPWRVASSELDPQGLSVPELHDYLAFNSDFPVAQLAPYRANLADRYALPLSCFVVVLIAAPLGIVYNRRGVAAAVGGALTIFFGMIMAHGFFMAMGKGMRVDPFLAPWLPNIILGLLGLVLLWFRSTNRDLPSLAFWKK
jgi:LPS export ABC transporter permease LptG